MLEAGLIISRFAHYLATTVLFGVALFPWYGLRNSGAGPWRLSAPSARLVAITAVASTATTWMWLAFTTASMNEDLRAVFDPSAQVQVLQMTSFGHLWTLRLILSAALVVLGTARFQQGGLGSLLVLLTSAALLATLAGTGHTQEDEGLGAVLHSAADATHLLAAGAWLGGLVFLLVVLRSSEPDADLILRRFSGMGYVAVALLIATGLVNSWFLVGSISRLITTSYGQLLTLKLGLFLAMLGLAAANRFWLLPALARHDDRQPQYRTRLRYHVLGEQALGSLVLIIVSVLGTLEPAMSLG